jgi:3-isopropylmalate/(R)-2-methylmalate dehydratase small subunit
VEKLTILIGIAAPIPLVNIDTDMIIPNQFLKTPKRTGLAVNLLDEMLCTPDGREIEDVMSKQPA